MSRIVVTGAGGFVGRHLLPVLAARGHDVLGVDRREPGERIPGVLYHTCDLADPGSLIPANAAGWDSFTLVHLAWDLRRDLGPGPQKEQVNHMRNLLDRHTPALRRVIVTGSAEEYGVRGGILKEDDPPSAPLSAYGAAKCAARELARAWSQASRIPVLWLRPFVVYGAGQGGDMLVPYAVRSAAEKKRAEFTDGLQRRDLVHVSDLIDALARGAETGLDGFHVVNIGTGREVVVRDVLNMIAEQMGAAGLFAIGARPRRAGEPDVQVADCARAATLLGWRARVEWQEGIRSLCAEAAS